MSKLSILLCLLLSIEAIAHEGGEHSRHDTDEPLTMSDILKTKAWSLGLELRPSWQTNSAEYFSENTIEGAYRFTQSFGLGYTQEFTNNIFSRTDAPENQGMNLATHEGYFIGKLDPILENAEKGISLTYEPRLILPTDSECRNAGMITSIRNDLNLTKKFGERVELNFSVIPILHAYSRAGNVGLEAEEGEVDQGQANPVFENRFYLNPVVALGQTVKLSIPIKFHATRYRDFNSEAKLNNQWGYYLWVTPEVNWAVTSDYSIGVSYYTGNLVQDNLSGFNFSEGFRSSVAQLIFRTEI